MKRTILTILASAAMLTAVGATAGEIGTAALRQATKSASRATDALRANRIDKAVGHAERAVLFAPNSAAHRVTLGQTYLRAGRFVSAETAFRDALRLDPSQVPATIGLALAQSALGRGEQARGALAAAGDAVQPGDLGLAYALAGDVERAVELLEPAARSDAATAKIRQNLAFSYALAGRWNEARATAALDLDPSAVDARMVEWASLARPRGTADQVAAILGVKPSFDGGMPAQLALLEAPVAPAPQAVAVSEPEAIAPAAPQIAEPVEEKPYLMLAEMDGGDHVVMSDASEPVQAAETVPAPSAMPSTPVAEPAMAVSASAPRGRWMVQLGAFSSADRLDQAWSTMTRRVRFIDSHDAVATRVQGRSGRTYYRLSLAGFDSRARAVEMCGRVKARGGDCFVRADMGDVPLQWAKRQTEQRLASR